MGGTSSGQLAYVKETVAGTTPATPAFKVVDITSEDLTLNVTQTRSAAITPQRVVRSSRRTGKEVGNGFNFELYKGAEIDALLASLLGQTTFAGSPLTAKAGGATVDSYTFERKLNAAGTDYRRFTGCQIGSMEFTIAPEAIATVRATVVGFSEVTAAAAIAGATYAAPTTAEKLTALDVTSVTLTGGLTTALDYESITLTVNNQLTARKRIGPNSVRGISVGQALVTGSVRAYVDKTLADAFIADTAFNMDIPFVFAGEGYTFLLKNIKQTTGSDPTTGNDDEYMSNFDFEATLDATFGSSFGITKTS
jgi:hypothetical protein